ncbi:MAG: sigma-70 family RNA polymerase sigma factor [Chloroflexia bacterium]|nr:sigma-70 family RNA polymerase sigma factor [Chloroflexia bacterium]
MAGAATVAAEVQDIMRTFSGLELDRRRRLPARSLPAVGRHGDRRLTDQTGDAGSTTGLGPDLDQDHLLVRRIAAGDTAALAVLYDKHAGIVHAVIVRVVHDHQVAEDLLQESFLRVWQHARTYDGSLGRVRAWLLGIAHNLALNELRRRRRRPQEAPHAPDAVAPILETVAAPDPDPADVAWSRTRQTRITSALTDLPRAQQAVIALYAAGHSQSEIAATLNEPLGTVKTRMRRGLQTLRSVLTREGLDVEI